MTLLLRLRDKLTPADHQTHRRYPFTVPPGCNELVVHVSYTPKFVSPRESAAFVESALQSQRMRLQEQAGELLAAAWAHDNAPRASGFRVANLLTGSLDDAAGVYRGAGHRHASDQRLVLTESTASPGLVPGALTAGVWRLTLTAHTVVSTECDVAIQIGAEIASSRD